MSGKESAVAAGTFQSNADFVDSLRNKIFYFRNGNVEGVIEPYSVNGIVATRKFRKWGHRYFLDVFDEFHGIYGEHEVPCGSLPVRVREIFGAGTREGISKLREQGRLGDYMDMD